MTLFIQDESGVPVEVHTDKIRRALKLGADFSCLQCPPGEMCSTCRAASDQLRYLIAQLAHTPPAPSIGELLEFERTHPDGSPHKARYISNELHMSVTRYFQLLNRYIDTADAALIDPQLVAKLRDKRDFRKMLREGGVRV